MSTKIQTFRDFKDALEESPQLQDEFKQDPLKAIKQFKPNPLNDIWVYRMVVFSLGVIIVLILVGIIILMLTGHINGDDKVPTIFTAVASAAIGALAGLLAPTPQRS